MSRFDRLVLAVVVVLGLTIGGLAVAATKLGPSVDSVATATSLDGVNVNTQIALTFTEPMDPASTQRSFRIQPSVKGDFAWAGNEIFFTPKKSLSYRTTYHLEIATVATGKSGKRLTKAYHASFRTQAEHLLFLGSGNSAGRLVLASTTGKREYVGSEDGLITQFSLSFDRSLAVYVKRGSAGQRPDEIWLLSLADNSFQRLFRRPDWSISQPHFSPDGTSIAFLATNVMICQKYYACFRDKAGPLVYLLNPRSGKATPFRARSDVPITYFIDYSPAGQLAYTDLGSALTLARPDGGGAPIHIPNRGNSLEFAGFDRSGDKAAFVGQTPNSSGGDVLVYSNKDAKYIDVSRGVYDSASPALSNTGGEIAYAGYHGERGIEPLYGINVYTFSSGATRHLTVEHSLSDWSPEWSPDDRYLSFIRSEPQEAMYMGTGEIWIMDANGRNARPLGVVGKDVQWAG